MPRKPIFYLPEVPIHIVQRGHCRSLVFLYFYDNKKHWRYMDRHSRMWTLPDGQVPSICSGADGVCRKG
jgi:hypothetical protein